MKSNHLFRGFGKTGHALVARSPIAIKTPAMHWYSKGEAAGYWRFLCFSSQAQIRQKNALKQQPLVPIDRTISWRYFHAVP